MATVTSTPNSTHSILNEYNHQRTSINNNVTYSKQSLDYSLSSSLSPSSNVSSNNVTSNTSISLNSSSNKSPHLNDSVIQEEQQRLIDYFVVCGLDKNVDLEPCESAGNILLSPLQNSYRCRVLAHYPKDVTNNTFDNEAIVRLSMPHGVTFKTHPEEIQTHPFLITRLDGQRYYGMSLTFYEKIDDTSPICSRMEQLQHDYDQQLQQSHVDKEPYSQHRRTPSLSTYMSSTSSPAKLMSMSTVNSDYSSLQRLMKPNSKRQQLLHYSRLSDTLYVTKTICLISQYAYYTSYRKILETLYRMESDLDLLGLPLESYLYNLLYDVYLPPPGHIMKFYVGEKILSIYRPDEKELPLLDFSLLEFFQLLGVKNVVDLFTCALLEHQIILKSSDYTRLMLVAECLTSLFFPFTWTLLYVPIVFTAALVCIDVPVPAIMGLKINDDEEVTFEAQKCVVNIDTGSIQLPEDTPFFPDRNKFIEELSNILSHFESQQSQLSSSNNSTSLKSSVHAPSLSNYSRSMNNDCYMASSFNQSDNDDNENENTNNLDEPSQALARMAAIAKRAGIILNDNSNGSNDKPSSSSQRLSVDEENQLYCPVDILILQCNLCIRECFLNRFAQLFSKYDEFICYPILTAETSTVNEWLEKRNTTKNFDRSTFISEQPKPYVTFLLAFMETQSFVSFIDSKIIARKFQLPEQSQKLFGCTEKHLQIFSDHIRSYRLNENPTCYESCLSISDIEDDIRRRFTNINSNIIITAPTIRPLLSSISSPLQTQQRYLFETLNSILLENILLSSTTRTLVSSIQQDHNSYVIKSLHQTPVKTSFKHSSSSRQTKSKKQNTQMGSEHVVESELVFQQLLKECTMKTKRMVLEKMSAEGINLGSQRDETYSNLEENVLIGGFCDLLERIWSHRLHNKPQGKSALWNHLKCYCKLKEYEIAGLSSYSKDENPALVWCLMRKHLARGTHRTPSPSNHRSHTLPRNKSVSTTDRRTPTSTTSTYSPFNNLRKHSPLTTSTLSLSPRISSQQQQQQQQQQDFLNSLPSDLMHDVDQIVELISPISSEVGCARAFIRLSLERKLLSEHLKELFEHADLLKSLYKRDSFLRADDGEARQQFLAHVESLKLIDYFSFTNSYSEIVIKYRVIIVPVRGFHAQSTTANPYLSIDGSLKSTKIIQIPKNTLEFAFKHKNLGQLTTLRIGHDNTGLMPRWAIEYVLVQNEITGHI
ncbi:unnamed protein product, partial [Didymodactylos carnosus]